MPRKRKIFIPGKHIPPQKGPKNWKDRCLLCQTTFDIFLFVPTYIYLCPLSCFLLPYFNSEYLQFNGQHNSELFLRQF